MIQCFRRAGQPGCLEKGNDRNHIGKSARRSKVLPARPGFTHPNVFSMIPRGCGGQSFSLPTPSFLPPPPVPSCIPVQGVQPAALPAERHNHAPEALCPPVASDRDPGHLRPRAADPGRGRAAATRKRACSIRSCPVARSAGAGLRSRRRQAAARRDHPRRPGAADRAILVALVATWRRLSRDEDLPVLMALDQLRAFIASDEAAGLLP
jgi:hypothetical protein